MAAPTDVRVETLTNSTPDGVAGSGPTWAAALVGVAAAAAALGTSELLAGLIGPIPSLVVAIGGGVIDLAAGTPVKDVAIALFGTNDKQALIVGTVILSLVFGAGLGVWARALVRRGRPLLGVFAAFGAFGLLGAAATTIDPQTSVVWGAVSAVIAVAAACGALLVLLPRALALGPVRPTEDGPRSPAAIRGRRTFVRMAVGLTGLAAVGGVLGQLMRGRTVADASRASLAIPDVGAVPTPSTGVQAAALDGVTPFFTPNSSFYRIDTALVTPSIDAATWSMRIHGMVDQEVTLDFDALTQMPQIEADITIACVSNEVGGDLIGNARWQGVRLADVLEMAGVQAGAEQVVGRSVDGWTAGFPIELVRDGRDAMVAIAMNGEPLPVVHGFPARLIVPGVYGYVSATKWLSDIELTTWDGFDGYWIPRGWSKLGPVKTQSRIDVPRQGQQLPAGQVVVAGVAWAQQRGVERVEVRVDGGAWQTADLADEQTIDTWRQWSLPLDLTSGEHQLQVRATDADGTTQSEQRVPVAPDGAEGFHTRIIRVA